MLGMVQPPQVVSWYIYHFDLMKYLFSTSTIKLSFSKKIKKCNAVLDIYFNLLLDTNHPASRSIEYSAISISASTTNCSGYSIVARAYWHSGANKKAAAESSCSNSAIRFSSTLEPSIHIRAISYIADSAAAERTYWCSSHTNLFTTNLSSS